MAAPQHTSRYREKVLSRDEIEGLIADGRKIVIVDGTVLKTDAWLPYHPGGDKAILHMVGRDATNEVWAFHSLETQQFMSKYRIGRIEGPWTDFTPPIQGGKFRTREEQKVLEQDPEQQEQTDSSSDERSEEPSPVFDGVRKGNALRRRKGSNGALSESSATSLETLDLEQPAIERQKAAETKAREADQLKNFPDLDAATQTDIITKYRELDQRIKAEGLYECNYTDYLIESIDEENELEIA